MKKILVTICLLSLAALLFSSQVGAQDGPTVTVDPDTVEAEGEAELVVTGEGFTPDIDLFVLSCTAPGGDLTAINGQEDCDVQNLTPVTADAEGTFEVTVTYTITPDFAVVVGDSAQTESAGALVAIAGGTGGSTSTTEAAQETTTTAAPESTTTTEAPESTTTTEAPDEGDDSVDGELPDTGAESDIIIGGALALAAAGVLAMRGGHLLRRR